MTGITLATGAVVYDPTGRVEVEQRPLAPRPAALEGLRVGVLDNSKWNAGALLRRTVDLLAPFASVTFSRKESFSKNADPALLRRLAEDSDVVVTAIGD